MCSFVVYAHGVSVVAPYHTSSCILLSCSFQLSIEINTLILVFIIIVAMNLYLPHSRTRHIYVLVLVVTKHVGSMLLQFSSFKRCGLCNV